jgi:endo-1,4-beta-xylanase
MQGRYYYELIGGLFDRIDAGTLKMDAITFWGFSDGISWRSEYRPQLYNSDLDPKYALYGAMQIKEYAGY